MAITLDGTNGINSSGVIVAPDGTASAPAITNDGDTNTGIFFPAADTIAFSEGGAEAMRITSDGRLGIGTTSPNYPLNVQGSGDTYAGITGGTSNIAGLLLGDADNKAIGRVSYDNSSNSLQFWTNTAERMRIDSSGNVGIGTTSVTGVLNMSRSTGTVANNAFVISNTNVGGTGGEIQWYSRTNDGTNTDKKAAVISVTNSLDWGSAAGNSSYMAFSTINANSLAERMRITSGGQVLINRTTPNAFTSYPLDIFSSSPVHICTETNTSAGFRHHDFHNPNGLVGYIATSGSSTSYVTSSDYRLKHDIQPMTGALAKVAQLKPVTYKWNADDSESQGFIAHELQAVVPDCVTGEKDAVDAEGNPQYQGVDTSFLVATLTAAIQELSAKNDALEARIAALEGAQA